MSFTGSKKESATARQPRIPGPPGSASSARALEMATLPSAKSSASGTPGKHGGNRWTETRGSPARTPDDNAALAELELDAPDLSLSNDDLAAYFDTSPFRINSLFNEIDSNSDSALSKKEFERCLRILGIRTHASQQKWEREQRQ